MIGRYGLVTVDLPANGGPDNGVVSSGVATSTRFTGVGSCIMGEAPTTASGGSAHDAGNRGPSSPSGELSPNLDAALGDFLDHLEHVRGLAPATIRAYRADLVPLLTGLGDRKSVV